jgi:hypothetical protein
MIRVLPTYKGYTVDMRLKEFRKAVWGEEVEFIPFTSVKGQKLLTLFLKTHEGQREVMYYRANN